MKSDFKKIDKIFSEIRKIVIGQDYMIDRLLIGLFTQGHILLEGVPWRNIRKRYRLVS